jgi:serine protease Do
MKPAQRLFPASFLLFAAVVLVGTPTQPAAYAQQKGGPSSKSDPKYLATFRDVVAGAAKSTFRIQCDSKDVALGVAVSTDGFILTKASDLTGKIAVKTRDGILLPAQIVGVHVDHDLAMLKVEAAGFVPVEWCETKLAPVGHFVVSCGPSPEPVAVGVVSVAARNVPPPKANPKGPSPAAGYLGVYLLDKDQGVVVANVAPNSAAARAAIKADDVIVAVDDLAIKDSEELIQTMAKHKAGDTVVVKIVRGSEEMELKATLGKQQGVRGDQNLMGSKLSNRRTGFPVVLQHDSIVLPEDCGGPLVDLEGRVIGLNIARAGRVESYAIPGETIRPLLADLMSGQLAPKKK